MRALLMRGLLAVAAAMVTTTLLAALARGAGVDLEVAGEPIPLAGVAFVTAGFSLVGVVMAAALLRWSAQPARRFLAVTVTLTALSLVPPALADADAPTRIVLVALHLTAAAVVVPVVARALAGQSAGAAAALRRSSAG